MLRLINAVISLQSLRRHQLGPEVHRVEEHMGSGENILRTQDVFDVWTGGGKSNFVPVK